MHNKGRCTVQTKKIVSQSQGTRNGFTFLKPTFYCNRFFFPLRDSNTIIKFVLDNTEKKNAYNNYE